MGIKNIVRRVGEKAADKVAQLSKLSPSQIVEVQSKREEYLLEMPKANDATALAITEKMLSASSIEIFSAYLKQIKELYLPMVEESEYDEVFDSDYNIRYLNITKWVSDKKEKSLEKLINVYAVLSNEDCNIGLIFNRTQLKTDVYLAISNLKNSKNRVDADIYRDRLKNAIKGNFPGSEFTSDGIGVLPCLDNDKQYSVATASNIPAEKSEKFISQTIEKLLDGIIPDSTKNEYTIVLLATPILDVEERKLKLSEFYSGLKPYSEWQQNFTFNDSVAHGSSATVGVNVGASAGVQNGVTNAQTATDGTTDSNSVTEGENTSVSDTEGSSKSESESQSHTEGVNESTTNTEGSSHNVGGNVKVGFLGLGGDVNASKGWNKSVSKQLGKMANDTLTKGVTNTISKSVTNTTGKSVANTLGKAVTNSLSKTSGVMKGTNLGVNFGANFARSSTVTATLGKSEGIVQNFTNHNIKHALDLLDSQMNRLEQNSALGMWDFAAYVLSEDHNTANNVAHTYLSLTIGEESYLSKSAINLWRENITEEKESAKEICNYIRKLRHPIFALNPLKCISDQNQLTNILSEGEIGEVAPETLGDASYLAYPPLVSATTSLSGKELAYSLNFPQKSVAGLPIIECAEFGRNVITFNENKEEDKNIKIGQIFHMNHEELTPVNLNIKSLASHTFITGSTGSGKSNTVYQIISEAKKQGLKFLVIEPAKGEYKSIFGSSQNVRIYGTNPLKSKLLKINPFSFPKEIHVLEHLDRLVEFFNVCWPMYAAMPAVLKNAVENAYVECGWNLNQSTNKYSELIYPTFEDVARNVKNVIESSEYDSENKGAYKGALLTRLKSLCNGINGMIFVQDELVYSDLFEENAIIDLSRIGSGETKSLMMGMLILKLQEYRMSSNDNLNDSLKHITVLEEAHNILKRTSFDQSNETSNLMGKSVEMLSNAIAEMRSYGEGFIIVDQAPGLLDLSVIRNTNTKIIMRLPDLSDRELVGKSANLNDDQIAELSKLPCGVAAVYQNEWVQPVLCKVHKFEYPKYMFNYEVESKCVDTLKLEILDVIMNKEILLKDSPNSLKELKQRILNSNLQSKVKFLAMEYLNLTIEQKIESLSKFVYEFFDADKYIQEAEGNESINEWVQFMTQTIQPNIKQYDNESIQKLMFLILMEKKTRDMNYKPVFESFVEQYKKGGLY